jgi:hypothetical protein
MKYKMVKGKKDVSPQEFVSFLKTNKVYKQFRRGAYTPCKNEFLRDFYQNPSKEKFSQKLIRTNLDYWRFLSHVFAWEDTKEGYNFWHSVRDRWEKI